MGLPKELRERPVSQIGIEVWTAVQLAGLAFLYQVSVRGGLGDYLLHDVIGFEPSQADDNIRLVLFILSATRAISQIFWGRFFNTYEFPVPLAIGIAGFNVVFDSMGALAALHNRTHIEPLWDLIIVVSFAVGILLERGSELQRHMWKSKEENKGKMHVEGPFGWIVHANYTGYLIWRVSNYAFSHSLLLQLFNAFITYDFVTGDIRIQHERNVKKYGKDFEQYWEKTPKLVPGVF